MDQGMCTNGGGRRGENKNRRDLMETEQAYEREKGAQCTSLRRKEGRAHSLLAYY